MAQLDRQRSLASSIAKFKTNTLKEGKANFTAGFLTSRKALLERYWADFRNNHATLREDADLLEDEYFSSDLYSETELRYTQALRFLIDSEADLLPRGRDEAVAPGSAPAAVHLPKIHLPIFSGRLEDWETFRDLFRSMIHLHPALSSVQKLHYLKTSIEGEAKDALEGLPLIDANYATAWGLLLKRYEHKRRLTHFHMDRLAYASPLTMESAAGLRSMLDWCSRLDRPSATLP